MLKEIADMIREELSLDTGDAWNLFMPESDNRKDYNNHAEVIRSAIIVCMEWLGLKAVLL